MHWAFWQSPWVAHGFTALIVAVGAENLTSGLGTGAFVALLMALCDRRFSATQYAVFSALDSAGRVFIRAAGRFRRGGLWVANLFRPEPERVLFPACSS